MFEKKKEFQDLESVQHSPNWAKSAQPTRLEKLKRFRQSFGNVGNFTRKIYFFTGKNNITV